MSDDNDYIPEIDPTTDSVQFVVRCDSSFCANVGRVVVPTWKVLKINKANERVPVPEPWTRLHGVEGAPVVCDECQRQMADNIIGNIIGAVYVGGTADDEEGGE